MSFIQELVNKRDEEIEKAWREFFDTAMGEAQKLVGKKVNLKDDTMNYQATIIIREVIASATPGHVVRLKNADGIISCIQETTEITEAND